MMISRAAVTPLTWHFAVERVTGIEPALSAWEADGLPLNYTREYRSSRCDVPGAVRRRAELASAGHRTGTPALPRRRRTTSRPVARASCAVKTYLNFREIRVGGDVGTLASLVGQHRDHRQRRRRRATQRWQGRRTAGPFTPSL